MKAADLIALLKDARGALHGAYPRLVRRLDDAVSELEAAQSKATPAPQPTFSRPTSVARAPAGGSLGPLPE